jgi:hypothetical protein
MLKQARLLTRPTLAVISPARPESAKTDSSLWDAPCPKQGSSEADPRFTFHASRFTVLGSDTRTLLGERCVLAHRGRVGENRDGFSIVLERPLLSRPLILRDRAC